MKLTRDRAAWLAGMLDGTDSVLDTATVLTCLTVGELRWRVTSGRWQQPFKGAIVAHNGPLTDQQSGLNLVVHLVADLDPGDVQPARQPNRTRVSRSLVDAAAWMPDRARNHGDPRGWR